jgi:hypothetical protein
VDAYARHEETVRPVTQSKVGKSGRCLNACLASLLEIPEKAVPDFGNNTWEDDVDHFLAPYGLYYRQVSKEIEPIGYHVAEGISPRGGPHAVIMLNGTVKWDPHPQDGTGRGLVRVLRYGVLIRRFNGTN